MQPKGHRRAAIVYTAAALKTVEHPLMRWAGEAEEARVERADEVRTGAILRALESKMGRSARDGEAEDIKEQIRLALERGPRLQGRGTTEVDSTSGHGAGGKAGGAGEGEKIQGGCAKAGPGDGERP